LATIPDLSTLGRFPASKRKMGIGIMVPISDKSAFGGTPRFSDMLAITQKAEELGFDGAWFADHFIVRNDDVQELRGVWEGWTTIAGIAAATQRISLGIFVTCVLFRNPGIIAKSAEMVDEISDGRLILGLGAGWHQPDFDMFGLPFDHRVSRFEDAVNIISPLLRNGYADFQGQYYQANDAYNLPRGPRAGEGGPPILIGTKSPRMMRLTAQFADIWNSDWHHDAEEVVPMLKALDEACESVGRDPKSLVRTAGSNLAMPGYLGVRPNPITGSPEEMAEKIATFRDLGLKHYVAGLDPCTPATLEYFARVVELLDKDEGL
jgi:alkanesulfonate monooxygenase SsuD/methylene tetrahydromethanopterin reductase-like flavin-dependent oxidoreductase (luciferase family)